MGRRIVRVFGVVLLASALSLLSPLGSVFWPTAGAEPDAEADAVDPEDEVLPSDLPGLDAKGDRSALGSDPRLSDAKATVPPKREQLSKLDPKRLPVPDMAKVDQERSSAAQLVWESSPGVFIAESSAVPRWFKAADGRWAEIDVSVAPVEGVAAVRSESCGGAGDVRRRFDGDLSGGVAGC